MALKIIVSYDDTDNDRDALALGRLLASPAPSSRSPTSATPSADRSSSSRRRSSWPGAPPRSATPDMPKHVVVNPAPASA